MAVVVSVVGVIPTVGTALIISSPGRPFCEFATYFSGNNELTGANTFVLYPILPSLDDHVSTAVPFNVSDE